MRALEQYEVQLNFKIYLKSHLLAILVTHILIVENNLYSNEALYLQKQELLNKLRLHHDYDEQKLNNFKKIYFNHKHLSQGNPKVSSHPVPIKTCEKKIKKLNFYYNDEYHRLCKDKSMAPLRVHKKGKVTNVCIDQFEFPNIPCEYPVVWVRSKTAHEICQSLGKRLCDASEWEHACAGDDLKDDYLFGEKKSNSSIIHKKQRNFINSKRKVKWAYGLKQNHSICATDSFKTESCNQALQKGKNVWDHCGSNTYPSGYYENCRSSYDVFDQHGNVAEHMNLPLLSNELTRQGSSGHIEMKGSWFIFNKYSAHPDDCYWRAPYWHGSKLNSPKSHHNYHLGFRCCKDV